MFCHISTVSPSTKKYSYKHVIIDSEKYLWDLEYIQIKVIIGISRMHDIEGYSININNLNVLSSNPHGGKKVSSFTTNVSFKLVHGRPNKRN